MKTRKNSLISIATLFVLGTVALSAQSCAAVNHASNAVGHSVQASGEVVAASVESGAASVQLASGVVAVPVMASGAVVKGTGALLSGIGGSADAAGTATMKGGQKIWDFATSDPAQRPSLAREKAVPAGLPPKAATASLTRPVDPSPAEALKAAR